MQSRYITVVFCFRSSTTLPSKWKLVEHWEDYEHSNARFYVKNKMDGFVPVHYEELP
jgi:hypothetical protein